ncbi:hypothetical protein V9T40_003399 [Parthenolecanium corni]|uniref:Uncharacterized protein n=1 Tax=Parthenolecanium corni TaxID=536013 RepID=A0AAN9TV84_9HEMI
MKVVQFSQKPQIYGLVEPGKNMKKIHTLVHLRIQLRNEEEHREFQLLAEMPEIFGHDIMFGRNGQDKVVYSLLAMIVKLPSASQNEIQRKFYIDWFQTTKIYTLFAIIVHNYGVIQKSPTWMIVRIVLRYLHPLPTFAQDLTPVPQ